MEKALQTLAIHTDDKLVQTKKSASVEVQTNENEIESTKLLLYDEKALAAFLTKICPYVMKELDRPHHIGQLATSKPLPIGVNRHMTLGSVLSISQQLTAADIPKVSSLSWSCTGSVLAVALSFTGHSSWCNHTTQLSLYNIDRGGTKPSVVLEVPSCVRSVCMHPSIPSIVAAGLHSGDVMVWDTAQDWSKRALLNVNHDSHSDIVTQVAWTMAFGSGVSLISSSLDGLLFLWKVSPDMMLCQVQERFAFNLKTELRAGISCFTFPKHNVNWFVVALEGGDLHLCNAALKNHNSDLDTVKKVTPDKLRNCSLWEFERPRVQNATVQYTIVSLDFSPFHDEQFATSYRWGVLIYSVHKKTVQSEVYVTRLGEPSVGVRWCPTLPFMLLVWGASVPTLHLVSLQKINDKTEETITLAPESSDKTYSAFSAVGFNEKSENLMACGDLNGNIYVFKNPCKELE